MPVAVATLASIIDNSRLTLTLAPSGVSEMRVWPVCRTRALVTQGHSCETSLIPVLRVFWGWGLISFFSTELFILVVCNLKQDRCPSVFERDQTFVSMCMH